MESQPLVSSVISMKFRHFLCNYLQIYIESSHLQYTNRINICVTIEIQTRRKYNKIVSVDQM